MKHLWILLLLAGCEGVGELGPKPTEIVLANAKKADPAAAPYSDPYADGSQLVIEKKKLARACDELQKKLSVLETASLPTLKQEKEAIDFVKTALPASCSASSPNLDADAKTFTDLAMKAYYLAYEHRLRAYEGLDIVTGKIADPGRAKHEKGFTASADMHTMVGDHCTDQLQAYLMFAPLPDREKAAQIMIDLRNKLQGPAVDFAEQVRTRRLTKAAQAEGNDALKKKLQAEIYGVAQ